MKVCSHCNVKFNTKRASCPFCHRVLVDDGINVPYQEYPKYVKEKEKNYLVWKIFIFISILAAVASIIINLLFLDKENPKYWFAIVLGGLFFLWILIGVTIISKNNIILKLILQGITIGIVLYTVEINSAIPDWTYVTYVIPAIIVAIEIVTIILALSMPKKAHNYLLYLIAVTFIGAVPFIIVLVKELSPLWPSLTCMICSGVTLFGVIFFGSKILKEELKKQLHV